MFGKPAELYDIDYAVRRIAAARAAVDQAGQDVILVARTEGLLIDQKALKPAIDKLVAFADAGGDCLYAPGVRDKADIQAMVRAVSPKPLNVLMAWPGPSVAELAEIGVRRISVGGALARVAFEALANAASRLKAGSFDALPSGAPAVKLNDIFGNFGGCMIGRRGCACRSRRRSRCTAPPTGGMPGSPTPPGGASLGTRCTSITLGAVLMRTTVAVKLLAERPAVTCSIKGDPQGKFNLICADRSGFDHGAGIHRHHNPWDRPLAVVGDRHLDHGRDVGQEAAVRRDAHAGALGRPAPSPPSPQRA